MDKLKTKIPSFEYKGNKLYLATDVSRLLGRSNYFVNTKISRGNLEKGTHYLELSESDREKLLSENDSFLWGRGRLKYFITEKGLSFLQNKCVMPNKIVSRFKGKQMVKFK